MAIEDILIPTISGEENALIAGISGGIFGALFAIGIMIFVLFIIIRKIHLYIF